MATIILNVGDAETLLPKGRLKIGWVNVEYRENWSELTPVINRTVAHQSSSVQ